MWAVPTCQLAGVRVFAELLCFVLVKVFSPRLQEIKKKIHRKETLHYNFNFPSVGLKKKIEQELSKQIDSEDLKLVLDNLKK